MGRNVNRARHQPEMHGKDNADRCDGIGSRDAEWKKHMITETRSLMVRVFHVRAFWEFADGQ